jgi:hypothetical protein
MQRTILTAIISVGIITTAHAQTATSTAGSDPLNVPTSSLPSSSSFSAGSGGSTASGSSTTTSTTNGSVTTTGPASGSTSGISASSRSSQAPLELPGEGLDSSTQSASSTAAAPSTPSTICPPSIPTSDGGSANITEIDGFSPNGC